MVAKHDLTFAANSAQMRYDVFAPRKLNNHVSIFSQLTKGVRNNVQKEKKFGSPISVQPEISKSSSAIGLHSLK